MTDRAQKAVSNILSLTTGLFDQGFIEAIEAAAATMMECPTIHLIPFRNNHAVKETGVCGSDEKSKALFNFVNREARMRRDHLAVVEWLGREANP